MHRFVSSVKRNISDLIVLCSCNGSASESLQIWAVITGKHNSLTETTIQIQLSQPAGHVLV